MMAMGSWWRRRAQAPSLPTFRSTWLKGPPTLAEYLVDGGLAAFVTISLVVGIVLNLYTVDRFARHGRIADAYITGVPKLGCFGPIGDGTGLGRGSTVYAIRYVHPGGVHETTVTRPCDVIPPDFGRGRGFIWIQYDAEDLDRTRVLNDTSAEDAVVPSSGLLGVDLIAVASLAAWWRRRIRRAAQAR